MRYASLYEEIERLVSERRKNYGNDEAWDYFSEDLFVAMLQVKVLRLRYARTREAKLDSLRDLIVYGLELWKRYNLGEFDE